MEVRDMDRRTLLKGGGAALAGLSVMKVAGPAHAFPGEPGEEEVLHWVGEAPPAPDIPNLLDWEKLESWYTPAGNFFVISHFEEPVIEAADWRLGIGGLVRRKQSLTLDDLKARTRREVDFTIECSGNHGFPEFYGAVGNARWAGAPLAPILKEAGVRKEGIEVVFWGADTNEMARIRDNSGVLDNDGDNKVGPRGTGKIISRTEGLDLQIEEFFARSMTLADAMNPDNLLCYEMNGVPLPVSHGFPVRLIGPRLVRGGQREVADAHRGLGPAVPRAVHGARLRHHPRAGARRQGRLDVRQRPARAAQVIAGQGHAARRPLPDHGRRLGRADRAGRGPGR